MALNSVLKATLGWGMEGNMDEIIRQGDGLVNFVTWSEYCRSQGIFRTVLIR